MAIKKSTALRYAGIAKQAYENGVRTLQNDFISKPKFMDIHDKKTGFSGFAQFNPSTKELIISFAGTSSKIDPNNRLWEQVSDLFADLNFVLREKISQLPKAQQLTKNALAFVKSKGFSVEDIEITFTGHSLGAILSELMVLDTIKAGISNVNAVVFDSPGTLDYAMHHSDKATISIAHNNIIDIISHPNIINVFGKQLGKVHVLNPFVDNPIANRFISILTNIKNSDYKKTLIDFIEPHKLDGIIEDLQSFNSQSIKSYDNWNNLKIAGEFSRLIHSYETKYGLNPLKSFIDSVGIGIKVFDALKLFTEYLPEKFVSDSLHDEQCIPNIFGDGC